MSNSFKVNFNFYSNLFLLLILFFGGLVWADSNGIWNEAADLRGGTIGSDEQDVTSNFTFINPVYFTQNLFYKNQEIDLRYVNEAQANSITSAMITDSSITSADILDGQVTSADIADGTITSADANSNSIQTRVTGQCTSGNFMYGIDVNGGVLCRADAVGSSGGGCASNTGARCGFGCGIVMCNGQCSCKYTGNQNR
jgi:hypothetical protein